MASVACLVAHFHLSLGTQGSMIAGKNYVASVFVGREGVLHTNMYV